MADLYFDGMLDSAKLIRDMCAAFSEERGAAGTADAFFKLVRIAGGVRTLLLAGASGNGSFFSAAGEEASALTLPEGFADEWLAGGNTPCGELSVPGIEKPLALGGKGFRAFPLFAAVPAGVLLAWAEDGFEWTRDAERFISDAGGVFAMAAAAGRRALLRAESQFRLERVLDSIDALIYVSDIDTSDILFINGAMKTAFGLGDDAVGQKCWKVLQEGMTDRCPFCPVHSLQGVGDPPLIWMEHNTKTGRSYRNTDRLIKWVDGRVAHVQHSVDVTDAQDMREKLDKTRLTLETVFNAVPSAIFWKSRDGRFEGANRQFLDVIGLEADQVIGKTDFEMDVPRESAEMYAEEDRKLFAGEIDSLEFERQTGPDKWTRQKKIPVKNALGETVSILGVIDDISVLKLSELMLMEQQARLEEAIEDAKAASQAKSVFLSRMSHEIRTPMNAIIGMTKIASDSSDMRRVRSCLQKITIASNQLMDIINDVLDMSKIEAGKMVLAEEDFNFEKLLMNLAEVLVVKADEKHQTVNFILDGDIPAMLRGDPLRLSQVITNLLSNAIKFTPPYGKIMLKAGLEEETGTSARVSFIIQDTGIGITDEQKSRLFSAFEQADGSISRRYGGTGLGLVICKNIVEMMDGSIEVESDGRTYSKFIFNALFGKSSLRAVPARERADPSSARVLLVDDDEDTREYFLHIAQRIGAGARVAESGQAAVEIIKEEDFDVVFVDFLMPNMDGVQTVRALRAERPGARYVLISGAVDFAEISDMAAAEGIDRFISKPLFDSVIISCLEKERAARDAEPAPAGRRSFPGKRILLVEDIEINREIVHEILADTGAVVDDAENGAAGVEKVRERAPYDLILMDIHMPSMNGYDAARAIRELDAPGAGTVPIIAMTADVFAEDIQNCLDAKMNGHLAKPIRTEDLFRLLHQYLD